MTTWFITGISRGLGHALAEAALMRGDTVVGTVRTSGVAFVAPTDRLHIFVVDLSDGDAAETAVREAFERLGAIDVVVNNAGYGLLGAIEAASVQDVHGLFAVDVFGPFRIMKAALPYLRRQGSGHIVNITSIAGRAPGVGTGLYTAAKFALEGLPIALAKEVEPLGIKVTAVAPGAFRTDFLSSRSARRSDAPDGTYSETVGRSTAALDAVSGHQLGDPAKAALANIAVVDAKEPPLHLLLGSDALRRAREKLEAVIDEMERWESITLSTDHRGDQER